jgi:hypothetical protein
MAHAQRARNRPTLLRPPETLSRRVPTEIRAAPGEPTGRIKRNPPTAFCGDQPDEFALGAHRPAADACSPRNALINPFSGHGKDVEALRRCVGGGPVAKAKAGEVLKAVFGRRACGQGEGRRGLEGGRHGGEPERLGAQGSPSAEPRAPSGVRRRTAEKTSSTFASGRAAYGASGARISMRQPERRAARRAFSPARPIASESWSLGTSACAVWVVSSRSTASTVAGINAFAT